MLTLTPTLHHTHHWHVRSGALPGEEAERHRSLPLARAITSTGILTPTLHHTHTHHSQYATRAARDGDGPREPRRGDRGWSTTTRSLVRFAHSLTRSPQHSATHSRSLVRFAHSLNRSLALTRSTRARALPRRLSCSALDPRPTSRAVLEVTHAQLSRALLNASVAATALGSGSFGSHSPLASELRSSHPAPECHSPVSSGSTHRSQPPLATFATLTTLTQRISTGPPLEHTQHWPSTRTHATWHWA